MSKLVGVEGNKIVEISSGPTKKEPTERMYEFFIRTATGTDSFKSFGVLVVTPGFVGVGDKDGTEIRSVVPLEGLAYVREAQSVSSPAQGSA